MPEQFLLTNDDGVDHPGLAALEQAMARHGMTTVVAPHRAHSGCSHQVTVMRPLELKAAGEKRHALDGTPADCTRVGVTHVAPESQWVISGINEGGNLGADVYVSGTVAAVREAVLLGRQGIAFSQYRRRGIKIDWQLAARWAEQVAEVLLRRPCPAGSFWNVNLPHLDHPRVMPEIVFCPLDPNPLPVRFRTEAGKFVYHAIYQDRHRDEGCDIEVCFSGRIAATLIPVTSPSSTMMPDDSDAASR